MRNITKSVAAILILVTTLSTQAKAATPSLTSTQQAKLRYLVEEEKLARDVYSYLLQTSGSQKFRNIARSEQIHMNLVSGILKTYGVTDPTIGERAGVFSNSSLAALYRSLTTSGSVDYAGAIAAGVAIEKMDIKDLKADLDSISATHVIQVLNILLRGSENHLAAFTR